MKTIQKSLFLPSLNGKNMKKLSFFSLVLLTVFLATSCNDNGTSVRYISFNIRNSGAHDGDNAWDLRKSATKQMLDIENPTVFGLQEALPDQLAFIDENFPQFSRVGVGRDDGKEAGEFMALYYRNDLYDLLDSGNFWLSETPDVPDFGWDAACIRIVTWACLQDKATEKRFYAFNTHLDHMGMVAREQSILLIVDKMKEIVKDVNAPVILSGDFNSDISWSIFDPLKAEMNDSREFLDVSEWANSFNGWGRSPEDAKIIDYIFYKNAKVVGFRTLNGDYGKPYISDHYPICAEFKF